MSRRVSLPPGWYPDPDEGGEGRLRWFDGTDWTEQTQQMTFEQRMLEEARRTRQAAEAHAKSSYNIGTFFWFAVTVAVIVLVIWRLTSH